MQKRFLSALSILFYMLFLRTAQAHPGHIAEAAGHGHWGAIIGAIAAAALAGLLAKKRKKSTKASKESSQNPKNTEEAPA